MRRNRQFIALIFLISCTGKPHKEPAVILPENSKTVITTLRDSLGTVSFSIPARFDTFFTWTNHSDCGKPCDFEQYRFQPKALPIFEESGFTYAVPDIPTDQFTIIHSGYFSFSNENDSSKNLSQLEHFKDRLSIDPYNGSNLFGTVEKIDDRYFFFAYIKGFDPARQKHFAKVAALTTI